MTRLLSSYDNKAGTYHLAGTLKSPKTLQNSSIGQRNVKGPFIKNITSYQILIVVLSVNYIKKLTEAKQVIPYVDVSEHAKVQ